MESIFLKILNMSITASFLILVVIILRLAFKNAPKWIRCVMWSMVGIKLLLPFSFESRLSVLPNAQKFSVTSQSSTSYINSDTIQTSSLTPATQVATTDMLDIVGIIWIAGVATMIIYMIFSFLKIRKTTSESIQLKDNIWICDHIRSPFVLGFFKPKIYLLSSMTEYETKYVVAHEQAHLKRMDNLWKPLGFILLCVHWFNPLCWIAYWLFNKDIELACDENVIKTLDTKGKKAYSTALLSCSADRHTLSACPIAFGENNVKQRIKSVLSYKKPTVYVVTVSITVCVVTAVLFMTSPISSAEAKKIEFDIKPTTTSVTTLPNTTMPETTVPPTEATIETTISTVPPAKPESTEAVVEESEIEETYLEKSYEEEVYYEENYYEDEEYYTEESYDDGTDEEDYGIIEPVPFDPELNDYKNPFENNRNNGSIIDSLQGSHSYFGNSYAPYNNFNNPDNKIKWDPFT